MDVKLIVGLGNPESQFDLTRHNIGFAISDVLTDYYNADPGIIKVNNHPAIEIKQKVIQNSNIIFLKPKDWMNSSGIPVGLVVDTLKVDPKNVIIIYDDMDFDFGDIKIKTSGSAGRHNGVQSIIDAIGMDFTRFRIGIGRPIGNTSRDHVLAKFSAHEQKHFNELFKLAIQVVDSSIVHGVQKTMGIFNRRKEVNE